MPDTAPQPPYGGYPAPPPYATVPGPIASPGALGPQPPRTSPSTREDLRAVIAARRDLGPDYEDALVDSFLDKLDVEIAARVRGEVAAHLQQQGPRPPRKDAAVAVALGSLGIGVPLTAIAAGTAHGAGMLLAWCGIVGVNLAYALSRRNSR
ncbi:hypothetical protein GCM10009530_52390 [Microbispora corallina]|uniref:Integral membrane protein n=1 Tax=Microbispora corallina TaxID=83302 RepID=A0ABQ4G309_9ACTN|nr:hypothetical protein [Microbispora corallina]GIH41414.1 hypothetical protein Mco01_44140 [Microbispora corallina]